ncbi:MAG: NADH-dependent butanol dehydrogenase A [Desulfovibrio sp.]
MHNFTYYSPTKVLFGQGASSRLMPELKKDGISRILILTGGKSVYDSGLYTTVTKLLEESGIAFTTVQGVQPNPRLSKVREAIVEYKKFQAEALLPIGGGSVFDSSKAVALGALSENDVWDIMTRQAPLGEVPPIYGILTLSGTSSEINDTGVITNEETHDKYPVANSRLIPKVSVVDPALQYTVPLHQIRHCAMDTLSHVLESYLVALDTSELIIEHCESYAKSVIRCMKAMPEKQQDYDTRAELAFCSTYAFSGWCALGRKARGDFASHRIGHALSALFDIPHGVTLGVIMPAWMQYIYNQNLGKEPMARAAKNIFGLTDAPNGDFAKAAIDALKAFVKSMDMPVTMRELSITEKDIPALAQNAVRTLPFGAVIPMDEKHITEILKLAL